MLLLTAITPANPGFCAWEPQHSFASHSGSLCQCYSPTGSAASLAVCGPFAESRHFLFLVSIRMELQNNCSFTFLLNRPRYSSA